MWSDSETTTNIPDECHWDVAWHKTWHIQTNRFFDELSW